jgi:magnesium chelatase accessory protein
MDWAHDGPSWPHHDASRFVHSGGQRWHVQQWEAPTRDAPRVVLLHGTGASTHSWRALAPLLARTAGVLAVDLPGHGFSDAARGQGATLPGMAAGLAALLAQIGFRPSVLVGHSAGAAIAVRMALDRPEGLHAVVSLNGALLPLHGLAGQLFSPLAKLLATNPLVPRLFSWRAADRLLVGRIIAGTGSVIDDEGVALYGRLVADRAHVAGALAMMAHWDLRALAGELPRLRTPLHLLAGTRDRTVPASNSQRVASLLPAATLDMLPGLGHLAHEEQPQRIFDLLWPRLTSSSPKAPSVVASSGS